MRLGPAQLLVDGVPVVHASQGGGLPGGSAVRVGSVHGGHPQLAHLEPGRIRKVHVRSVNMTRGRDHRRIQDGFEIKPGKSGGRRGGPTWPLP